MKGDRLTVGDVLRNRWVAGFTVVALGVGAVACDSGQRPETPAQRAQEAQTVRQLGVKILALYDNPKVPASAKHEYTRPAYTWDVQAPDGTGVSVDTETQNGDPKAIWQVAVGKEKDTCSIYFDSPTADTMHVDCHRNGHSLFGVDGDEVQEDEQTRTTTDPAAAQRHRQAAIAMIRADVSDAYRSFGL